MKGMYGKGSHKPGHKGGRMKNMSYRKSKRGGRK
jgi:hypothetical protein